MPPPPSPLSAQFPRRHEVLRCLDTTRSSTSRQFQLARGALTLPGSCPRPTKQDLTHRAGPNPSYFLSFPSEGARAAAPRQQQRQARQALRQVEQGPSTQPARSTRTHARAHARAHARPAGAAAVPEVRGATRHAREGMQERGGVGTQEGGGETCTGHTAWGAIHAKGRPGGGGRHLRSARTCLCAASSKRPVKTFCPA